MKLPENSQFQQLVFDLLGSPWRTNVPGILCLIFTAKYVFATFSHVLASQVT